MVIIVDYQFSIAAKAVRAASKELAIDHSCVLACVPPKLAQIDDKERNEIATIRKRLCAQMMIE